MDKALAVVDYKQYAVFKAGADLRSIISENMGGAGLTAFGLDRARVPAGGIVQWLVPTLDDPSAMLKSIEGIILYKRPNRSFWKQDFASKQQNSPPDCSSSDLIEGNGTPGGLCKSCPYNEYGSMGDGKLGKRCRETMFLFVLRPNEILPLFVAAPTMSVKPMNDYLKRLTSQATLYYHVVTGLELEQVKNASGIAYAKIKPRLLGRVPENDRSQVNNIRQALMPFLSEVALTYEDVEPGRDATLDE